jgi:hypothetical protein
MYLFLALGYVTDVTAIAEQLSSVICAMQMLAQTVKNQPEDRRKR